MTENIKVVAHHMDGTLVKGSTQDFHPDRPMFRVVLPNGVDTVPVQMAKLKAVFFVKDLDGHVHPPRRKDFLPDDPNRANGRPVAALFKDGELIVGYTLSYNPDRQGFFLLPVDPADNNLRIFVIKKATKTLKLGPAAEEFTRAARDGPPPPAPPAAAA